MDYKKIARGVGMLALQQCTLLVFNCITIGARTPYGGHSSGRSRMGLEEFNRNKHVLLLAREFM